MTIPYDTLQLLEVLNTSESDSNKISSRQCINLSQKSKRATTFFNFEIHSLLPYSPNLSPVEMVFGMSKRSIAGTLRHTTINLSEPTGRKEIINSFRWLNTSTVLKLWGNFVKEAKGWIHWSRKVYLESRAFTWYA